MYPLARSRSRSRSLSRFRSRYSDISLVIESERERTGADADAQVDTLLKVVYPIVLLCPRLRCASVLVLHPHSHSMTRHVAKWT